MGRAQGRGSGGLRTVPKSRQGAQGWMGCRWGADDAAPRCGHASGCREPEALATSIRVHTPHTCTRTRTPPPTHTRTHAAHAHTHARMRTRTHRPIKHLICFKLDALTVLEALVHTILILEVFSAHLNHSHFVLGGSGQSLLLLLPRGVVSGSSVNKSRYAQFVASAHTHT